MIRVLCSDKTCGYVKETVLDDLIRRGVVIAFFRSETNEWVDVRSSHIRKKRASGIYKGPERRKAGRDTFGCG